MHGAAAVADAVFFVGVECGVDFVETDGLETRGERDAVRDGGLRFDVDGAFAGAGEKGVFAVDGEAGGAVKTSGALFWRKFFQFVEQVEQPFFVGHGFVVAPAARVDAEFARECIDFDAGVFGECRHAV